MDNFSKQLHSLWTKARQRYLDGNRDPQASVDPNDIPFLQSIGMNPQEIYDFTDDSVRYTEPDFVTMLLIQDVRYQYFQNVMNSQLSSHRINPNDLPAKTDAIDGITWLPRILKKAHAKLRGELPDELMYGCAGDRKFFKRNNIHPAEFLKVVWLHNNNDQTIIQWVKERHSHVPGILEYLKSLFD